MRMGEERFLDYAPFEAQGKRDDRRGAIWADAAGVFKFGGDSGMSEKREACVAPTALCPCDTTIPRVSALG